MKWSEVEITDLNDKIHTGDDAFIFCKPRAAVRTTEKGLIEAFAGQIGATTDDIEVRKYLFGRLKGKAKGLRFLTTVNFKRAFIPVVRGPELNIFNVDSARLKVEFIYKRDPKGSSPRKFLEDSIVTVKALLEGSNAPLTMITKKGIADFGKVFPGKYTITPDYSNLKDCEYDYINETRNVVLEPAGEETVEFQVEPLYQKVQFIGHCLLTIPKQVYFPDTIVIIPERIEPAPITMFNKTGFRKIRAAEDRTPHYWKAKYNGYVKDEDDINARVKTVKDTIALAHQKAEKDPTILKVFVLPECYFQGKYGAYKTEDVFRLLDLLQDVVKDEIWKDWIFAFGTVNGSDSFAEFDHLGKIVPGGSKGSDVFNISPVIRGGHGGKITAYRHLIQKAYFSAEMIHSKDLIPEQLERVPWTSDAVAFQPTENEQILGDFVRELVKDPTADQLGISNWDVVKLKLGNLTRPDLTKMIREVREGAVSELKETLEKCIDRMINSPKALTMPDPGSGKPVRLSVQPGVVTPSPNKSFKLVVTLLDGEGKLANAVTDMDISITVTSPAGDVMKLTAKIETGKSSDDSQSYTPTAEGRYYIVAEEATAKLPPNKSSFFVVSRDLLSSRWKSYDYRDYVFACARKAGPWLELAAAEPLETCKKLILGLEICADHNKQALVTGLKTKQSGVTPVIDIHLVPSAGMYPVDPNVAARDGGYIFNCDGWNISSAAGGQKKRGIGKFVPTKLDGNEVEDRGIVINPNIWNPHTVLCKGGGSSIESETKGFSDAAEVVKLDGKLEKGVIDVIFGEGAGELHLYVAQDLPK